jgi:hypothetical protein
VLPGAITRKSVEGVRELSSDELADVILTLGDEDSPPFLTEHGQNIYNKIIDGSNLPEFGFDWPDED